MQEKSRVCIGAAGLDKISDDDGNYPDGGKLNERGEADVEYKRHFFIIFPAFCSCRYFFHDNGESQAENCEENNLE